jgi:Mce-associated membrane protein
MTGQRGKPGGKTNKPEKESDAMPIDTESATGDNAAADVEETTEKVEDDKSVTEDDASASEDAEKDGRGDIDTESADEHSDEPDADKDNEDDGGEDDELAKPKRTISFSRIFAFGVLPLLVLLAAGAGAYFKWQATSMRASQIASIESLAVAKDTTIAMLSYQPDTVEKDLGAARDRLTGTFKDSYTQLTEKVVIPGSKQKHISAVATVPAAAPVSATASHAVALVFVNQSVVVGKDAPSTTGSSLRITMEKVGQRWLISGFDPV